MPLRQPKPIFCLANTLTTVLTYSKLFAKCVHIGLHGPKLAYKNLYKYGTMNLPQRKKCRRRVLLRRVVSARTAASSWEAFVSTLQRVLYAPSCCAPSPATQEDATLNKRPPEAGVKPKGLFSHNENWETDVPLT